MKKLLITGYGVVLPNADNVQELETNLLYSIHNLNFETHMTPFGESTLTGRIKESGLSLLQGKEFKRYSKQVKMAMISAKEALQSTNTNYKLLNKKVGVFVGISLGCTGEEFFTGMAAVASHDFRKFPLLFPHVGSLQSTSIAVADYIGFPSFVKTISTACTSSLEALEVATQYLETGRIDVAIVIGTEASIHVPGVFSFCKVRALNLNQDIENAGSPFNEESNGFVLSEGSASLIIERESDVINENRETSIKGILSSIITNNDSVGVYNLETHGKMMKKAILEAIEEAGHNPDFVNSNALGIQMNDRIEESCSGELFNHSIPYLSIKGLIGNPLGAVGLSQVIASLLSFKTGTLFANARTNGKGYEAMNLPFENKISNPTSSLITNHGYGGQNAVVFLKKWVK